MSRQLSEVRTGLALHATEHHHLRLGLYLIITYTHYYHNYSMEESKEIALSDLGQLHYEGVQGGGVGAERSQQGRQGCAEGLPVVFDLHRDSVPIK